MSALLPWAAALAGCGLGRLLLFGHEARRARRLAADAIAYERILDDAGPALLVVGDSLSVGVGAHRPEHSVAGRIARACPDLTVVNRARCGARLADVPSQLEAAPSRRWDAVLMTIGGNDALARTPDAVLARDARRAVAAVSAVAPRAVVTTSANVGGVPIVPWPLTRVLEARSRAVRDALHAACDAHRVEFVDFFRPLERDPFARDPELFFGPDGVHPSTACYELCFRVIEARTGLASALGASGRVAGS
ncbi:MAG TPA: GDSL-type esterase/lipase family protein [Burkholderiaceae bacterium]|nr:GDSL-type esterase/lipase family protein [Burkholderiaceae bacterium]